MSASTASSAGRFAWMSLISANCMGPPLLLLVVPDLVTDGADPVLEAHALELFMRERDQQVDPAAQVDQRGPERLSPCGVVASGLCRIRNPPVGRDRAAGEPRADLPRAV